MSTQLEKLVTTGQQQAEALAVGERIYANLGVGNAYLVTTDAESVIVNAGTLWEAKRGCELFAKVTDAPISHVILTQSHVNQYGGVECFMQDGTKLVTQRNYPEGRAYVARLQQYYDRRNEILWGPIVRANAEMRPTREYEPDIMFDDRLELEVGGRQFELLAVPGGETRNALFVWLPQDRIAIVGNLFGPILGYQPNLNTVRGDKPRSAKEFIASAKRVRDLAPEVLHTGHETVRGADAIRSQLDRIIDAVQYLLDYTLDGMNAGTDLPTLMGEVELPAALRLGEGHGKAMWNVRAIWAEYTGWFNYDSTAALYPVPRNAVAADIAELAGGAARLAERATERLAAGDAVEAIHLLDIAIAAEPDSAEARAAMLAAHECLLDQAGENLSETMWLKAQVKALGDG